MADITIDAMGLRCPIPIVRISRELKKIDSGQTVEVKCDDPAFAEDVKAFCRITRNKLENLHTHESMFTAVISKPVSEPEL